MIDDIITLIAAGLLAYVYAGYPFLAILLASLFGRGTKRGKHEPSVALLIAAYNEEAAMRDKLENSLALEYPKDKFEIHVGSDGSTDRTCEVVRGFADRGVRLLCAENNRGKATIQNKLASRTRADVLVFSDATGAYPQENLRKIASAFHDERVGCVCGVVVDAKIDAGDVGRAARLHVGFERTVRRAEARLGVMHSGSGSIIAVRGDSFVPIPADASEDFYLPLRVAMSGRRVVLAEDAPSYEVFPSSEGELLRATARTSALDITTLWRCRGALAFWRRPLLAFSVFSHRVLRYLVPFFWIVFAAGAVVADSAFVRASVLGVIGCGVVCAGLGWTLSAIGLRAGVLRVASSYAAWNLAVALAWVRVITGRNTGRWKPERKPG
jgi:glycosyltransferase involved in cell wall biosynthesis